MELYEIRRELEAGKTIYDLPLRVTFYARVSTDTQEQAHSLKAQRDYYKELIQANQNWQYVEGYYDFGITGTTSKREGFLCMIADGIGGKFDFVITKEISRFSRNTLDSIQFTQKLLSHGVGVYFQTDNINTMMSDAELRLTIMSSIAQEEVRKTSERIRFGFKRSIKNGVVLGNNRMFGYRKNNGKLMIQEDEAEMIRLIFDLYANHGMGFRRICTALSQMGYVNLNGNEFDTNTIKRIVTNPKYKGYYCGNKSRKVDYKLNVVKKLPPCEWVSYKDHAAVPPIVSEEIWARANEIFRLRSKKQRSKQASSYQNKYVYSGKVYCREHDVPYQRASYKSTHGSREVWQCRHYAQMGRKGCHSPVVYTTEIESALKGIYARYAQARGRVCEQMLALYQRLSAKEQSSAKKKKLETEVFQTQRMKDSLLQLYAEGAIARDEFKSRNDALNEKVVSAQNALLQMYSLEAKAKTTQQSWDELFTVIVRTCDFTDGFPQEFIDAFIKKITVYQDNDSIKTEKTGEREKRIGLDVYFSDQVAKCVLRRRRGALTSVCSPSYLR